MIHKDIENLVLKCKTCHKAGWKRLIKKIVVKEQNEMWVTCFVFYAQWGYYDFVYFCYNSVFQKWVETNDFTDKSAKSIFETINTLILKKYGILKKNDMTMNAI